MEWIQKIDFAVLDWIQQHIKGDFLDFLMPLITALGNGGIDVYKRQALHVRPDVSEHFWVSQ